MNEKHPLQLDPSLINSEGVYSITKAEWDYAFRSVFPGKLTINTAPSAPSLPATVGGMSGDLYSSAPVLRDDGIYLNGDRIIDAGFTPMSGTSPKPVALSTDTRTHEPLPATAFKRWEDRKP